MTDHNQLKKYARRVLEKLGFEETEIEEEYSVSFEGMRERLIVDVVGMSENRKVAIECGNTPSDKLIKLHMYFDEVILLPYFKTKVSDAFVGSEKNMAITITRQEKKIAKMQKELEDFKAKNSQQKETIKNLEWEKDKYSYDIRQGLGALIFHYCDLLDCLPWRLINKYELSNARTAMEKIMENNEGSKVFSDKNLRELSKKIEEPHIVTMPCEKDEKDE